LIPISLNWKKSDIRPKCFVVDNPPAINILPSNFGIYRIMSNMQVNIVVVGPFEANCYLIKNQKDDSGIIIDPGGDERAIINKMDRIKLMPRAILLTHGHGDHIAAVRPLMEKYHLPLYVGEGDEPLLASPSANISALFGFEITCPKPDYILSDDESVEIAGIKFKILATPGHTSGGICFLTDKFLFCGDTLFKGSIGRTDLPGGDFQTLINSIDSKVLSLPDDIICYPGHGPETTVGFERKSNPFLTGQLFV